MQEDKGVLTMLPIAKYKSQIIDSVVNNAVTIITAETGSGKSTQVCQYLHEAGYEVIVTEPRRIAAISLASRVSEEMNDDKVVGYHIAFDKSVTDDTRITFCSDGVQLVKQLTESKRKQFSNKPKVLIMDEVHEWNLNIETLVAWCKKMLIEKWNTKIVIMSATLNHEDLSAYFFGANVICVPGNIYPVESIQRSEDDFIRSIEEFHSKNSNILAFVPGKKEIEKAMDDLRHLNAEIIPLHGDLTVAEQKLCFKSYDRPKIIIATNIAQTSITVPDIDVIIDTGTERRIETHDGVQGLFLKDISKADCMQRKGRAGRTKPGIYVLCGTSVSYRQEYQVPEIQRLILDQMVLRLMDTGIDATELEFFHQPNLESIIAAKKTLQTMKAIENNCITELGKKILLIPTSVKYARMIIEADTLGVVDDVVTITSILEIGSLLNHKVTSYYNFTNESSSDLLAELDVWNSCQGRKVDFKQEGIFAKNFFRIKDLRQNILQAIEDRSIATTGSTGNRSDILTACIIGMMDNVYCSGYDSFTDGISTREFQLDNKSCVDTYRAKWITGIPMTIEFENRYGSKNRMDILRSLTKIDEVIVRKYFPEMFSTKIYDLRYDQYEDCVVGKETVMFGNVIIDSSYKDFPNHPDYVRLKEEFDNSRRCTSQSSYYHEVEEQKQRTVTIDGQKFDVQYPYSFSWSKTNPYIELGLNELKSISETKSVKLQDGTDVDIRYGRHKANNIQLLKQKVSSEILKQKWDEVVYGIPTIRTKKCKMILEEFLGYVGEQEVSNGFDDHITAYVCLDSSDGKIGLNVKKDGDEAQAATNDSLKYVIDLLILDKYPSKNFEFKVNGKRALTNKGNITKTKFQEFVNDCKNDLTVKNVLEYIEMIDEYYQEIMAELLA